MKVGRRIVKAAGLWGATLMMAVAMLGVAGCGSSNEAAQASLEQGIETEVAQLSTLTTETATRLFGSDFTNQLLAAGVDPVTVYGPMFSSLSCVIDGVEVNGDEAQAHLSITNKDLTTVLQNYTATVTNELATQAGRDALAALDNNALTQHLATVLVQSLQDANVSLVTTNVDLSYAKSGSVWTLQNPEVLSAALLGGLDAQAAGAASDAQLAATAAQAAADLALVTPAPEPAPEGEGEAIPEEGVPEGEGGEQ